jgi:glyoxylase-like metal-dependent hydrolase (beta-lactamase superfamily II)
MPCPSFLVEHPRGLVLFDTGVSPKGLADPERWFPDLVARFGFDCDADLGVDVQLRSLGYRTDQVSYVVPSHLHLDHAGGLYLFPDATFLIGAGEMDFAYHPDGGTRAYFLLDDIAPTRGFRWIETNQDFDLFGDGSVRILYSPGHTPGSLALFVRLPSRNLILTGDTCHFRTEVEAGACLPDMLNDHAEGNATLRRLMLYRDAWDADIWIAHDIDDWNSWPHAPDHVD